MALPITITYYLVHSAHMDFTVLGIQSNWLFAISGCWPPPTDLHIDRWQYPQVDRSKPIRSDRPTAGQTSRRLARAL